MVCWDYFSCISSCRPPCSDERTTSRRQHALSGRAFRRRDAIRRCPISTSEFMKSKINYWNKLRWCLFHHKTILGAYNDTYHFDVAVRFLGSCISTSWCHSTLPHFDVCFESKWRNCKREIWLIIGIYIKKIFWRRKANSGSQVVYFDVVMPFDIAPFRRLFNLKKKEFKK